MKGIVRDRAGLFLSHKKCNCFDMEGWLYLRKDLDEKAIIGQLVPQMGQISDPSYG